MSNTPNSAAYGVRLLDDGQFTPLSTPQQAWCLAGNALLADNDNPVLIDYANDTILFGGVPPVEAWR